MNVSLTGLIDPAIERTKQILFRPLDLGKWLVIAFGCWLAQLTQFGWHSSSSWSRGRSWGDGGPWGRDWEHLPRRAWEWLDAERAALAGLALFAVVALVVLAVALFLVLLWLSSRGQFIFLDNVVHNRAAITEPWHRHREAGGSLFRWRLGFLGVVLAFFLALALLLLLSLGEGLFETGPAWPLLVVLVPLGALGGLAIAYVDLFLKSFVVPIMFREGLTASAAWRRFSPLFRRHAGTLILYGLLLFVLAIGLGLLVLAVGCATCCLGFVLLMLPYVGTAILLPVHVFFRAYSLEILAAMEPELNLFAVPEALPMAAWPEDPGAGDA